MPVTATSSQIRRGPRRARFEPKANPAPIRLTARDIAIVRAIGANRVLNSHQVWQTVGGSKQKVLRRLEALFDHGYIGRPRAQVAQLILNGGQPLHYELRRAGALLLVEHDGADMRRYQWATKGKTTRSLYIEHTAETAAVMLAFRRGVQSAGLDIIEQHDLLPHVPEKTRSSNKPFRFWVTVKRGGKNETLAVVPDRLFSLVFPDQTKITGVLERDRDTMPITRPTSHGRNFDHKFETYFEGWKAGRHTELWGIKQFFVFVVTETEAHLTSLLARQREITDGGNRLFMFSTPERISKEGALGRAWTNGRGELVAVVE